MFAGPGATAMPAQPSSTRPDAQSARMPRRGSTLLIVLIAAGLLVVLIGAIALARAGRGSAKSGGGVDLKPASRLSFEISVTANGELKAANQKDLKSELEQQTTIVEIVDEGKFVRAGDVLVRLNADEIQKEFDEAEDRLRSQENDVRVAENDLDIQRTDNASALSKAETGIKLAELELQKWLNGDDKEQRQADALAIEKGEREEKRLKEKLERSRELFEKQFLSSDELKQDETAYLETNSELQTSYLKRDTYEKYTREKELTKLNSDLDEARKELERVQKTNDSNLNTKQSQLDLAKANLRQVKATVDRLREQLENTVIKAPTDGLVVYASSLAPDWRWDNRGPIAVGREVHPNESIISLPDTSGMTASIKVHESMISKITPGQTALVTIDAAQGRVFNGKVESTGIIAESGGWSDPNLREYEVKITLELEPDHGLKPSMRCEAKITLDSVNEALAVPLQAVFIDKAVNYVYTAEGDRYARTPVKIGKRSDLYAEVVDGLKEGTRVLMREPALTQVKGGEFSEEIVAKFAAQPRRGPGAPGRGAAGATMPAAASAAPEGGNADDEEAEEVADEPEEPVDEDADTEENEGAATPTSDSDAAADAAAPASTEP
jgi:RND family efflux transporter MFP subunit